MRDKEALMLDAAAVTRAVSRRLSRHFWDTDAQGVWPWGVSLRLPAGRLLPDASDLIDWADAQRAFCLRHGLELIESGRNIGVKGLTFPSRVVVPSEGAAAGVSGRLGEVERRDRLIARVEATGVTREDAVVVARGLWDSSDAEVDALLSLGVWARTHTTAGLTPRQLPVPGVQGKSLDAPSKRAIVARVAGVDDLGLVDRSYLVSVRYLDPGSSPRFALALPDGDDREEAAPTYGTSRIVIVENRDTFLCFPLLAGGTCVLGDGKACVRHLPRLRWVMGATSPFYWGDMDLDGLLILSELRRRGLACRSILMDLESWRRYEWLGTNLDRLNRPIDVSSYPEEPAGLTDGEGALYRAIRSGRTVARRVEQERIPYADALEALGWEGR